MYEAPIRTTATIVTVRRAGVFEARLPNGKIVCAHLAKAVPSAASEQMAEGSHVTLELTPYDFDSARISGLRPGPE